MTTECIHGLELSRCDLCSPQASPKPDPVARPATRTRTRPLSSSAPRRTTAPAANKRPVNVGEQRIHHVTHVSNLAGILRAGAVFADSSAGWSDRPTVDMSSRDNRELRRSTTVTADASVAAYVPFYLSPDATLWQAVRAGSSDPRLSATARRLPASEFVLLVSTVKKVAAGKDATGDIVVTDRDAADPRVRLATSVEDYERLLRRLIADRDSDAMLGAEFLVRDAVPLASISLIGVANDKAREAVREILEFSDFQPRVAVHPPWFAVPAAE